ncbi:MAG: GH3 auxin-responsive promoter family protein [Planctomycetaceae bacterium]
MRMLGQLRAVAGILPRVFVRRELQRFLAATRDCRETQRETLNRLLWLNQESRFSADHRLSTGLTPQQFRERIPITTYDDYAPYIQQMLNGDHRALLGTNNPLLMFSLSSGTTQKSKYIPITLQFLKDYKRGWQNWGIRTLDEYPAIHALHILQLSSSHDRFRTPGGTPCGNISGLVASMQKRIVQTMYTVTGDVARIESPEAKQYTALRLALADEDVGMVITANPSTLVHLARKTEEHLEDLTRDIADGTLSEKFEIPNSVRKNLKPRTSKKNRKRARFLEQLIDKTGHCYPRDYWPNLQVVGVWTGGSAGAYLNSLRTYYGDVPVRDHGLHASEGRMTIPLQGGSPQGVLDVCSHYFEFIPEEEFDSQSPTVLEAHEVEPGRNYYILMSTSSGFCRYNICDVVRCTGYYETTPMFEFLHKGAHISNLTGEKISESQVVAAVREAINGMPMELSQFTVAPVWGEIPKYQLLVEQKDFPSLDFADQFARKVDSKLKAINCEYREKRETGRLAEMGVIALPAGTWEEFTRCRQQGLGGSLEQYKHPCLIPDLEFADKMIREYSETVA